MRYADAYLESKVMGASNIELITILYEKAIVSLEIAKQSITEGVDDTELIKKKTIELARATEILFYLNDILDRQRGGKIAENLSIIYTTLAGELVMANLFNDVETISKCIEILNNLKYAWEDVKKESKNEKRIPEAV